MASSLKLIGGRVPVARPFINPDKSISWPWSLSTTERRADKDCCRGETLNAELLGVVLDVRNAQTGVVVVRKRENSSC